LPTSLTKFEEKLYSGSKVSANLNNSMVNNNTGGIGMGMGVLDL